MRVSLAIAVLEIRWREFDVSLCMKLAQLTYKVVIYVLLSFGYFVDQLLSLFTDFIVSILKRTARLPAVDTKMTLFTRRIEEDGVDHRLRLYG